jgi:hypothetical protein
VRALAAIAAALATLGVAGAAFAANTLSVTAPRLAEERGDMVVAASGNADEPGLEYAAYVQKEACAATFEEQDAQPGAARQGQMTVAVPGAFEFQRSLTTTPNGVRLTGPVNVCSFLFRGDRTTVAADVDVVNLVPPGTVEAPPPTVSVPRKTRMTAKGVIKASVTCPQGCELSARWKGRGAARALTRSLEGRDGEVTVRMRLNRRTRKAVRRAARKGFKVLVNVTASAPSGDVTTVERRVRIRFF